MLPSAIPHWSRLDSCGIGIGIAQANGLADRSRQDQRVLACPGGRHRTAMGQGSTVDLDDAAGHGSQADQRVEQAGLAASRPAQQCDRLARFDHKVEARYRRAIGLVIADRHIPKRDARRLGERNRGRGRLPVEQGRQPRDGRLGCLPFMIGGRQPAHRSIEFRRQRQREKGAAQVQRLRHREGQQAEQRKAAIDRHQRDRERGKEFQRARGKEGDAQHAYGSRRQILRRCADPCRLAILGAKRQHHRQCADAIGE